MTTPNPNRLLPVLTSLMALAALGCDPSPDLDEHEVDALEEDSDGSDEDLVVDAAEDPSDAPVEAEPLLRSEPLDDLVDEDDPVLLDGPLLGGTGGYYYQQDCPSGTIGIGTVQAETGPGNLVRQVGLVCGPVWRVASSQTVPSSERWVIWSRYYNTLWGSYFGAGQGPQAVYDIQYAAPNDTMTLCDPGYALSGLDVRTGSLVDRIHSIRCFWAAPGSAPGQSPYWEPVGVGGWGGSSGQSECKTHNGSFWEDDIVRGIKFRAGALLDAVGVTCD